MEQTYDSLLELAESPSFDIFQCLHQLKANIDNIGVHHYLVKKLYKYSYLEAEFFIPQLIQLLVSFETESMALHDFLLDYSRKYPHFCLITFWNLQAYVFELKNDPESYSFHIVRGFINELQNVMFNQETAHDASVSHKKHNEFRENLQPAIAMCGAVLASIAVPQINKYANPIIESQGRQQKSLLFKLANFHKSLTKNLTLKNRGRTTSQSEHINHDKEHRSLSNPATKVTQDSALEGYVDNTRAPHNLQTSMAKSSLESWEDRHYNSDYSLERDMKINTRIISKKSYAKKVKSQEQMEAAPDSLGADNTDIFNRPSLKEHPVAFHSMPDLRSNNRDGSLDEMPITPVLSGSSSTSLASLDLQEHKHVNNHRYFPMHQDQKIKYLQVNYFKKETEFMMGLQNISTRLSQVPKEARLTSLRAELSIINNTIFPSEIDIPQLLPISSKQNKKFHRIIKLNVNEACVLNSAERVPFLLLIEYLSEEMDFDPLNEHNKSIILNKSSNDNKYANARRSKTTNSDFARSSGDSFKQNETIDTNTSFDETDLGDMSVVALSNEKSFITNHLNSRQADDMTTNRVDISLPVPQNPNPERRQTPDLNYPSSPGTPTSIDTRDLSTQMRIAAVMLQQLEKSGQTNTDQTAAIRTRIIDSMKALQDKFENIDYKQIQAMQSVHVGRNSTDAGERKLENDFKLSEDWATKKNRIRQASAYGHLKNWDLCSVIAKNGDDLPQEAFACQLISMISNIWKANKVGVWTKNMKIIVTSANTGLVETINNAMSIHSIKKTLTDLTLKSGENPKGKVASLKDYFNKVYGSEDSFKYKKAQQNFAKSLAAYSVICYVLQIKDRHNGNIMLDNEGHIIHIDFGFLLSNSPGSVGFEAAPFKLIFEYVEVLGGLDGPQYLKFKELCKESFKALRKNCDHLINIVDLMQKDSSLPCFKNGAQTSVLLKQRLQLDLNDEECDAFVETGLIGKSIGSVYTRLYDQFQLLTQGIYS